MIFVFLCLTSLSMMIFRSIMLLQMALFHSLLKAVSHLTFKALKSLYRKHEFFLDTLRF